LVAKVRASEVVAVQDGDVTFIRLWFTDTPGQPKSFAITVKELDNALTQGMGFDGSSITGFNAIEGSDMIAMPDPDTFAIHSHRPQERSVARMFCDIRVPGGEPYEGDPRYVLRRALGRAKDMGFAHFLLGPELEYLHFRSSGRPASSCSGASGAHPRTLRGAEARRVGGPPNAGRPLRARAVPAAPLSRSGAPA
jgi:glutamine synthetase